MKSAWHNDSTRLGIERIGCCLPSFLPSFFGYLAIFFLFLFFLTTVFWLLECVIHSNNTNFHFGVFTIQTLTSMCLRSSISTVTI